MFLFRTIFLFFIITCLAARSFAQEEFITPSRFITQFSFRQLTGGVVILNARFGSFPDTLNFILDTGSGGISLDSLTVEYFGLKPTPSDRTIRGIAGLKKVGFLNNQILHFPGLTVEGLNFHVNDYGVLTNVYGEKIDGIIGFSVLSRYIIKINYDSSKIEFWTRGILKYPRGGYLLKPLITTLPVQELRVRDERTIDSRFLYDMGAGLNMMLSTDFIKDSNLLDKKRKLYVKQAEGIGGKIDMHMTVIKEVRIGPYRFRKVPIYIFDDEYNVTSYPYLGGLIGNDLLRRFNVILNYDKRDIYLMPNSHFNEPFDYAYSGIELYFEDGLIVVGDVAKGSAAEAAGVQEGDVVVGINRNFSQNLQQMKQALQNTGDKARMIVRRGTELMAFEFKIKSILK
ncbi:MAG: aspartyl protease family protein [Bacteroidota bacterium]|nr:aspartyl protease family protein [Bacteroidota bacterium]